MDLSGRHCLITGANSGLGLAAARRLAGMGASTILLCRSKERGEKAIREIGRESPHASTELMICDLSSLHSVKRFIEDFKGRHSVLDILYNNAAVMKQRRTVTEDGLEMMFQVNYVAPFLLMNSLLEVLKNGSSPFIINIGRPAEKYRLDIDDLQATRDYHMYHSFFRTKLCLLFASLELSRRDERDGVAVAMIDPGPFKSDLVREVPLMGWFKNLFSATADRAAENILYHVTSSDSGSKNGKVFREKKEEPLTDYWQNARIGERLWSATESLVGDP